MTTSNSIMATILSVPERSNVVIRRVSERFGGTKARELERFIKFLFVGASGLIIDLVVTNLMLQFVFKPQPNNELPAQIANGIGFVVAISSNFTLNRFWTYPDSRSRPIVLQIVQFFIVNALSLLVREIIVTVLHNPVTAVLEKLTASTQLSTVLVERLGYNAALLAAIVCVMMWNFFVNRYWTYGDVK